MAGLINCGLLCPAEASCPCTSFYIQDICKGLLTRVCVRTATLPKGYTHTHTLNVKTQSLEGQCHNSLSFLFSKRKDSPHRNICMQLGCHSLNPSTHPSIHSAIILPALCCGVAVLQGSAGVRGYTLYRTHTSFTLCYTQWQFRVSSRPQPCCLFLVCGLGSQTLEEHAHNNESIVYKCSVSDYLCLRYLYLHSVVCVNVYSHSKCVY